MKTIFFLLACTCLINGLSASFFENSFGELEKTNFENYENDALKAVETNPDEVIVPYPTIRPRPPVPTIRPSTLPPRPSTTTPAPTPSTTTSAPTPSTTTSAPRPTTTRPGLRNAQIYNNAYRSMGPLAARLVNVVVNKGGVQKTVQENDISYNLNYMKRNGNFLRGEIEN